MEPHNIFEDLDYDIDDEIKRRREWLTKWFGEKCPEFEESCIVCQLWKSQDDFEEIVR